jgi:hypothetical protein
MGLTKSGCHGSYETYEDYFSFQFWQQHPLGRKTKGYMVTSHRNNHCALSLATAQESY